MYESTSVYERCETTYLRARPPPPWPRGGRGGGRLTLGTCSSGWAVADIDIRTCCAARGSSSDDGCWSDSDRSDKLAISDVKSSPSSGTRDGSPSCLILAIAPMLRSSSEPPPCIPSCRLFVPLPASQSQVESMEIEDALRRPSSPPTGTEDTPMDVDDWEEPKSRKRSSKSKRSKAPSSRRVDSSGPRVGPPWTQADPTTPPRAGAKHKPHSSPDKSPRTEKHPPCCRLRRNPSSWRRSLHSSRRSCVPWPHQQHDLPGRWHATDYRIESRSAQLSTSMFKHSTANWPN